MFKFSATLFVGLVILMLGGVSVADSVSEYGYFDRVDRFDPRNNKILLDDIPFTLATRLKVENLDGNRISLFNIEEGNIVYYQTENYPNGRRNGGPITKIIVPPKNHAFPEDDDE